MMMMMLHNRTRNLALHGLCNLAFLPTFTVSRTKGDHLCNTTRFYCVHPPPPPPTSNPTYDTPRGIKGALQWYFATSFETVPYTNRTRRILYPRHIEKGLGQADFNDFIERYQENEGWLLSPTHPDVVRVKMVLNNIIDALQSDLNKMGNATSSYNSIAERVLMSLSGNTPPATTSHLDGLDWDVFVVNDPDIPDIPFIHCCYSEGKIVVNQYLVNRLDDIEIATIFGLEVARIVGRCKGEKMTKEMWITFLNDILGENFTKHIGQRIISIIQQLPFNTRFSNDGKQNFEAAWEKPLSVYKIQTTLNKDKISSSDKSRMNIRFPTFGKFKVFPEKHDESFKKRILDPGSDIFLEWKRAFLFS